MSFVYTIWMRNHISVSYYDVVPTSGYIDGGTSTPSSIYHQKLISVNPGVGYVHEINNTMVGLF